MRTEIFNKVAKAVRKTRDVVMAVGFGFGLAAAYDGVKANDPNQTAGGGMLILYAPAVKLLDWIEDQNNRPAP